MLLGIDHIVVAVHDPDAAVEELSGALGVAPGGGGTHPAWGTRNRLIWLGDTFIELLGISDARLAAGSWLGAPALAALATGPGLVGWAIATDDLEGDVAILRAAGAELGPIIAGERQRPDGATVRWRLALPPGVDLRHPFLIEHEPASAEWTDGDRTARALVPGRLRALHLPVDRVYGLTVSSHDHAVALQSQRIVTQAVGEPIIQLTGLRPVGRSSRFGCSWSLA